MNDKNTGGPAFPTTQWEHGGEADGISIRDYFAAKAMQGICASLGGVGNPKWQIIAADAYTMADAMLRARENT